MKKFFAILIAAVLLLSMTAFAAPAMNYVYVTGSTNVRSGPGAGYNKLATLKKGSTVDYLWQTSYDSSGKAWYRVSVGTGNAIGWVLSDYAYLTNNAGTAYYADGANAGGNTTNSSAQWDLAQVVSVGSVNVRTGPGVNYEVVKTMAKGDKASYLGNTAYDDRGVAWYQVKYKNSTGWVSSTYAHLENTSTGHVTISGGNVNVRTGAGMNYKSIGTAYKGEVFNYMSKSAVDERGVTWYQISFNGKLGWVSSTYAKLQNNTIAWYSNVTIEGGKSNVRTGPGLGYKSIGTAYKGETYTYQGMSSVDDRGVAWYQISFNGKNGWVSSTYAKLG